VYSQPGRVWGPGIPRRRVDARANRSGRQTGVGVLSWYRRSMLCHTHVSALLCRCCPHCYQKPRLPLINIATGIFRNMEREDQGPSVCFGCTFSILFNHHLRLWCLVCAKTEFFQQKFRQHFLTLYCRVRESQM